MSVKDRDASQCSRLLSAWSPENSPESGIVCQVLTSVVCLMQTTRDRFVNKKIDVTIREINRRNRKITLNMVEAAQILAYRNLKVCRRPTDPYYKHCL